MKHLVMKTTSPFGNARTESAEFLKWFVEETSMQNNDNNEPPKENHSESLEEILRGAKGSRMDFFLRSIPGACVNFELCSEREARIWKVE